MPEWTVVTVLVVLLGLVISIVTPIIKLNTTITKLTGVVDICQRDLAELTKRNSQSHERLFNQLERHEDELTRHAIRLHDLDGKDN